MSLNIKDKNIYLKVYDKDFTSFSSLREENLLKNDAGLANLEGTQKLYRILEVEEVGVEVTIKTCQ